jgi:hypothetical protein
MSITHNEIEYHFWNHKQSKAGVKIVKRTTHGNIIMENNQQVGSPRPQSKLLLQSTPNQGILSTASLPVSWHVLAYGLLSKALGMSLAGPHHLSKHKVLVFPSQLYNILFRTPKSHLNSYGASSNKPNIVSNPSVYVQMEAPTAIGRDTFGFNSSDPSRVAFSASPKPNTSTIHLISIPAMYQWM